MELRIFAHNWVVLPVGEATLSFTGMLNLNDSGAMLWKVLEKNPTREALVAALRAGYEVNNNDANQGGETDQTQSTIPTGPQKVEENTDPAQPEDQLPTVPEVPETTEPVQPDVTEPTAPETEVDTTNLTYAQFHELTGIQQQEIMESFESIEAFFLWYDQAKAEHEKENPPIEIEDGQIDLEKIPGGN